MALNPKQQRFVAEYLVDYNATQAAIRAGYSPHTANEQGSRLLAHASIRTEIDARSSALMEKVAGSAEWIVEQAVEVVRRSMAAVPVRDSKGRIIEGVWDCDLRAAVPALALLARRHPEFNEKHDVRALVAQIAIPEGTTLDDIRALRDGIRGQS